MPANYKGKSPEQQHRSHVAQFNNIMKQSNNKNRGLELYIEAASLLFEDPEKLAAELPPEEYAEYEELLRRIDREYESHQSYNPGNDNNVPLAAEDEEQYK